MSQGVLEEAYSPWSFPLVPVPKKNSDAIRWVIDYLKLNADTKKDASPLLNIMNNLSRLSGSCVFTALDGAGDFHVVPVRQAVRQADHENTAFSSPFAQFQVARMPLGLANAPATYSLLISKALLHIPGGTPFK